MEFNLLPLLNCEGKQVPLDLTLEIAPRTGDNFRILGPVSLVGNIINIGGSIELNAKGQAELILTCDRCTEEFSMTLPFTVEERFKKEDPAQGEEPNPDITVLEGNTIDLAELAYDGLALQIPSKILCGEDCLGLCPNCGQNLNHGECGCDTRTTDPRFDVLDQLL
ncbi:MAG: DUF177 domain-containing protein [Clostridia bacterium]|nr:DUF177 domain-containing protein [Clostridia bacterium]